jgi:hypothetical protein
MIGISISIIIIIIIIIIIDSISIIDIRIIIGIFKNKKQSNNQTILHSNRCVLGTLNK